MEFTEKEEALVKGSWEIMKNKIPQCALSLSTLITELDPSTKPLFSYLRGSRDDELPQDNPKHRAHMTYVFKFSCEAACQLREKGCQVDTSDPLVQRLGLSHFTSGVLDPHFEVVKEALLMTIKEATEDYWSEDLRIAWAKAYDLFATAIKSVMNDLKQKQHSNSNDNKNNSQHLETAVDHDQKPTS